MAYASGKGGPRPSLATLNVPAAFIVAEVGEMRVELSPPGEPEARSSAASLDCRPVSLTFSYELKLRLAVAADVTVPGSVVGSAEWCLADTLPVTKLPFGHGLEILSGIQKVDAALAERLSTLQGIPIRRTLTATRQIEGGEKVSASQTLELSDFRTTEIAPDRFEVPRDHRYEEPVVIGPVRQKQ